jgi:glycosyltransferase involved in cell wall biosynthesis
MYTQPLFPHIGICALVPDQWNSLWQPRHYVLSKLARYFHVVWVPPAPDWRAVLFDSNILGPNHRNGNNESWPAGLVIYEPEFWLMRFPRAKRLARATFDARIRHARRILTDRGCRKIILYIWRPEFAQALKSIPFDLSCYHIDDEYSFSEAEVPPDLAELALINRVDQVFIHSPGLISKKGAINPHTTFVPNGVDFEAYASLVPEPADMAHIPYPRIGYTGWIKKQLDWSLILDLTKNHPEWSFVFVGPQSPHPEIADVINSLSKRHNVYFLGAKSVAELAAYPQHFDVCIMPYRQSFYTQYIYPLKLHEYLASGRPIVGTRIRSLEDFGDVVMLAETSDDWHRALQCALETDATSESAVVRRQQVARKNDWNTLTQSMAEILCQRLGPEYSQQWSTVTQP